MVNIANLRPISVVALYAIIDKVHKHLMHEYCEICEFLGSLCCFLDPSFPPSPSSLPSFSHHGSRFLCKHQMTNSIPE